MIGTIVLLGLLAIGVWVFGSLALRVGEIFLVFLGAFGVLTGTSEALIIIVLGAVAWIGGHWWWHVTSQP